MNEKARTGMTNIIGEGTEINGKILVPGSIRVDGKIDGDITVSDQITIGKSGFLKGVLLTRDAVVAGRMEGTITVKNRIELQKNAKVNIDLKCKLLIIEEGVVFDGTCSMDSANPNSYKKEEKKDKANV